MRDEGIIKMEILRSFKAERKPWSKKGDFGKVLIIGGSKFYSGCLALAGLSALRSGADVVTVYAPKRAANAAASISQDLISIPADCNFFTTKFLNEALELARANDAVLIGNGIGRNEKTLEFVRFFLRKYDGKAVVDADALYALPKALKSIEGKDFLLTPHSHEFFVISGKRVESNIEERKKLAYAFAENYKLHLILKGHYDVVVSPNRVAVNKTGSPYMTVAGTGDCLAGIALSFVAQCDDLFKAASAAAFLNGLAGELASKKFKSSLLASDIIDFIPKALWYAYED